MKEKFTTAATAISTGVAGAFAVGVTQSLDMSSASSKLQAQLGLGPAKAAELSKTAAKVYAQGWGESTAEVNEAIKGVYQQIGDVSKVRGGLQGVTKDVLALAQTFDQDLGGVTAAVGQMLKTGLAKDAGQALDIITKGFQIGNDKAGDLLDTMNEYGTQFRDLGIDGSTAMGIIKQGLQGGARDADMVADAMKELNIRVQDQSAAKGLKALGLNAHTMAAAFAGGGPKAAAALQTITDKLRSVTDPTKRYALAQKLLGTQSEDLSKALYAIDPSTAVQALGKVGGAADQMAKTVGNNPASALESFKRQAQLKLAEVSGSFVQFAMQNQAVFKPVVAALGVAAGALLAYTVAAKIYAIQQAFVTEGTLAYAVAQWAVNSALLANPMTWIVIGILALIAVIVLIATKTTWFRQLWHAAWGAIKGAASAAWGWIKKNWPLILAILTGPIGLAVLYITKKWDSITGFFSKAPGRIARATRGLFDGIKSAFRSAINFVIGGWNRLRFSLPRINTHIPGVGTVGGGSFGVPQMPYLAKGGHILGGGMAMVGERGPEQVYLPTGATVAPLPRGGARAVDVNFDVTGVDAEFLRIIRKMVRVYGRGNVQVAFGPGF